MASAEGEIPDAVKRNVRAVLLSKIGGVEAEKFNRDYKELLGEHFPYKKMGYPSLKPALQAMPDVVRFDMKNGKEHLFGIADETSFMSSFAVKAQFSEFDEKKDRRKRRRDNNHNKKGSNDPKPSSSHQKNNTSNNKNDGLLGKAPNLNVLNTSGVPVSKKYPGLTGNIEGLYAIVVHGAQQDESKNIAVLFNTVGPIAEKSNCGNLLFYRFKNLEHAEGVIEKFHGFQLGRYTLRVEPAKEKAPRLKPGGTSQQGNRTGKVAEDRQRTQGPSGAGASAGLNNTNAIRNRGDGGSNLDNARRKTTDDKHLSKIGQSFVAMTPGVNSVNATQKLPNSQPLKSPLAAAMPSEAELEQKITELNSSLLTRQQQRSGINPLGNVQNKTQNMNTSRSHANHVDTRPKGQGSKQRKANEADLCMLQVSNIANSLLERDVRSFLEPYNPMNIRFHYQKQMHTYYQATVELQTKDAEQAIQKLNGKIMYDMPLSVRPFSKTKSSKQRNRNTSEGSVDSGGTEGASSEEFAAAGKDTTKMNGVDGSGDHDDKPMPSLADFADRFGDLAL